MPGKVWDEITYQFPNFNVWDEITYQFPNFHDATVEV